jgi:hypothetical protein
VYLTWANVLFLAFFAFNEINKLRVISRGQNSDSLHRHFLLRTQGDHWIDGGRTAGRQVAREQRDKKKQHGDKRGGWEIAWGKVEEHAGDQATGSERARNSKRYSQQS